MGFYKDWFREQTLGKNVIFRVGNAVKNQSDKILTLWAFFVAKTPISKNTFKAYCTYMFLAEILKNILDYLVTLRQYDLTKQ